MTDDLDALSSGPRMDRSRWLLVLGMLLAACAVVNHFLPLTPALRNQTAAIALVWVSGLGILTWFPKRRFDLTASIVVAGGLSINVIVTTTLLILDWYTPDRAAVTGGAIGLLLLALSALRGGPR